MGDLILLSVLIPEIKLPFLVATKVIWISHNARRTGFGVGFTDDAGLPLRHAMENLLGGSLRSQNPTYTM